MSINSSIRAVSRRILRHMPTPVATGIRAAKQYCLNLRAPDHVFREIFLQNSWGDLESVSGPGSSLSATVKVRTELPIIIKDYGITSLLDLPCGDVNWIRTCLPPGISYVGGDIVSDIVERNKKSFPGMGTFVVLNLLKDPLPTADLALVRDCFIHLPNRGVRESLSNIAHSGITYLLTTTFPQESSLTDIELGGYRPINLEHPYFGLPAPIRVFLDEDGIRQNGKSLALWRVADLPKV